ncbi:hypothetical protein HDU79_009216 [Rhizoclosmatium sp. JEL0117]|nr:hypothetical protein HDU79_009216 [Rhizoclosmatium sp. JEL0117]
MPLNGSGPEPRVLVLAANQHSSFNSSKTELLNKDIVYASEPRRAMAAVRDQDSIHKLDLIVVEGGRVLLHEVINGLLTHKDWNNAINVPVLFINPDIDSIDNMDSLIRNVLSRNPPSPILKTPILALTTLSGLRIFSYTSIECTLVPPPPSTTSPKSFLSWLWNPQPPSHQYNLTYFPFNTTPSTKSTHARTPSPLRNPSNDPDALVRESVGPPLPYFYQIITQILRPSLTDNTLPDDWKRTLLSPLNQHFTLTPSYSNPSQKGISVIWTSSFQPSAINSLSSTQALCLHPPLVVDEERPRIRDLVIDGVPIHETRGFSVELLSPEMHVSILNSHGSALDIKSLLEQSNMRTSKDGGKQIDENQSGGYGFKESRRTLLLSLVGLVVIGVAFWASI